MEYKAVWVNVVQHIGNRFLLKWKVSRFLWKLYEIMLKKTIASKFFSTWKRI